MATRAARVLLHGLVIMRITTTLVQVAAVLVAAGSAMGCGGTTNGGGGGGGGHGDAGDAGQEATVGCGGCGCGTTNPPVTHDVPIGEACALLDDDFAEFIYGAKCGTICSGGQACEVPSSFFAEVQAMNPDAGVGIQPVDPDAGDAGGRMLACPTSPAMVTITCTEICTGRRTEGVGANAGVGAGVGANAGAGAGARAGLGARLAVMAHLEAVSVHAFARLERELGAHGAGPELLRDVRRARRDEVRHTAMTARLAKRHGVEPVMPDAPVDGGAVRSLVEIAIENAVEGCVRETYGATQGLVEARTTRDRTMARLMKGISIDECRHAELAWAVHGWAMARLGEGDRARVREAMRVAVEELAASDPRGAGLLFEALPVAA